MIVETTELNDLIDNIEEVFDLDGPTIGETIPDIHADIKKIKTLAEITDFSLRAYINIYTQAQKKRMRINNQIKAYEKHLSMRPKSIVRPAPEPEKKTGKKGKKEVKVYETERLMHSLCDMEKKTETAIGRAIAKYVTPLPMAKWAMQFVGIGPITAAKLISYIDWERCPTASSLHKFAGIGGPKVLLVKGVKRTYNQTVKTALDLMGDQFLKQKNCASVIADPLHPRCFYINLYARNQAKETAKNANGAYSVRASEELAKAIRNHMDVSSPRKFTDTETKKVVVKPSLHELYSAGKLTDMHILLLARRKTVQMFLNHYWEVGRKLHNLPTPPCYAIAHLGHSHYIAPPLWPMSE